MSSKRILFVIQLPPPIHGASTMNQIVYNRVLHRPQYTCKLITLDFARDLTDLQKFRSGKVLKAISIYVRLCFSLLVFRPNIVYFSMVPLNFVLIRDAVYLITIKILRFKTKPVIHLHRPGMYEFNKKWKLAWLYRLLFRRCTLIHLSNQLLEKEIIPLRLTKVNLLVIPNSINVIPNADNPKRNKNQQNILFLSNLYPHKGYSLVVEAIAILKDEFPDLSLTLAGDATNPAVLSELNGLIRSKNISDRIVRVVKVDGVEKEALYCNAGIFVLPSKSEYFPLVILEAMSHGIPVISGGMDNLSSTFDDYSNILFLKDFTPNEIAEKIRELLTNHSLYSKLSRKGFIRWQELQSESNRRIDNLFLFQ